MNIIFGLENSKSPLLSVEYLDFDNLYFDEKLEPTVGSNFVPNENFPIPLGALDASQKYQSDCQKPFVSKMLQGKNRAYRIVRFFTAW